MLLNGRTRKTDKTRSNSSADGPRDRARRKDLQQREEISDPLTQEQALIGWGWECYDDAIDPYPTTH